MSSKFVLSLRDTQNNLIRIFKTIIMKLAEALLLRADLQKKITRLTARITPNMVIRAGNTPQEDPAKLMAQLRKAIVDLQKLIVKINITNVVTTDEAGKTLMESLAIRDAHKTQLEQLRLIRQSAQIHGQSSYNNTVNTIKITTLQSEIDQTGRAFREIDTKIQGLNWLTDLRE